MSLCQVARAGGRAPTVCAAILPMLDHTWLRLPPLHAGATSCLSHTHCSTMQMVSKTEVTSAVVTSTCWRVQGREGKQHTPSSKPDQATMAARSAATASAFSRHPDLAEAPVLVTRDSLDEDSLLSQRQTRAAATAAFVPLAVTPAVERMLQVRHPQPKQAVRVIMSVCLLGIVGDHLGLKAANQVMYETISFLSNLSINGARACLHCCIFH